jgi:hypothetical protein
VTGVRRSWETDATRARRARSSPSRRVDHRVDVARELGDLPGAGHAGADVAPAPAHRAQRRTHRLEVRERPHAEQVRRPDPEDRRPGDHDRGEDGVVRGHEHPLHEDGDRERRLRDDEHRDRGELPPQPAQASAPRGDGVPGQDGEAAERDELRERPPARGRAERDAARQRDERGGGEGDEQAAGHGAANR